MNVVLFAPASAVWEEHLFLNLACEYFYKACIRFNDLIIEPIKVAAFNLSKLEEYGVPALVAPSCSVIGLVRRVLRIECVVKNG